MKLRGLVIATVLLAALSAALYWSNRHPSELKAEGPADAPPKILSVKESEITKFELKRKDGDSVAMQRDSSGKWQMTAPKTLPVDQSAVQSLLGTFSTFEALRLVEVKASDLKQYGLDSPSLEVDLTEKDNQTPRLLLGDAAPTGNAIYAKLAEDARVFTIPSYQRTSIDKTANDLRDKRLLTVDPDKISQVEIDRKNGDIVFGRSKETWQIVKPEPVRADDYEISQLVRNLAQAQMDLSGVGADEAKTAAGFAGGSALVTAKITDSSGTQELEIRKNKDDYYAKSSVVAGVYKIASDLPKSLDKDVADFRDKKLFEFGYNDPDKVEIHSGGKTYFLTKGGDDWWSGAGKKLDADDALAVVSDIRELSATKFPTSGFTSPVMEITVTSDKGKRVEDVLIAKFGEDFIAERKGEPALYQVDDKAIKDLQKAAEDLKPAAAASASK